MHGIQIPSIQYCANLSLLIVLVSEVLIFIVSDDSPMMKQICNTVLINVKLFCNWLFKYSVVSHRRNEERGQGGPWAPPIRSKIGFIKSKIGPIRKKRNLLGMCSFIKIPLVSPIFYHKEQICFCPPNFIAQLRLYSFWCRKICPLLRRRNFLTQQNISWPNSLSIK